MALPHQPFSSQIPHSPFLSIGGGGGGLTLAEVLEILAGTKEPKSIRKAALSEEVNELLGKGGPPSGAAGGVLAGLYPNPSLAAEGVTSAAIKLLAITEVLLGEEAVSSLKLKAKSVTSAKIALEAVLAEHLAGESVTTAAIKLLAITTALLAEESVTESKLALAIQTKLGALSWVAVEGVNAKLTNGPEERAPIKAAVSFNGQVFLTGAAKAIAGIPAGETLFTLPAAMRPAFKKAIQPPRAVTTANAANLEVKVNGEVVVSVTAIIENAVLVFDAVQFSKIA